MTLLAGGEHRGSGGSVFMGRHLRFAFLALLVSASVSAAPSKMSPDRVADYSIDVRLNTHSHSLDAREVLVWYNTTAHQADSLYFHLYPNGFRSGNTSFMTEAGRSIAADARGWIEVLKLTDMRSNDNLTDQIEYARPDDGNLHDSTVMVVQLGSPVRPGDSITVSIDFHENLPEAVFGVGWAPGREFYFMAGWFPQLGVYRDGKWTCHQLHPGGGPFADFGTYDVRINLPMRYVIGATGVKTGESMKPNGTITYRYVAAGVDGFAWTASPDFVTETDTFSCPGLPDTKVILLLQPEHRGQGQVYFDAVDSALKYFGLWYGPYPYPVLTVVDPSRPARVGSDEAGDEYLSGSGCPMLIRAGTSVYRLKHQLLPEIAITNGLALQYWSGIVAVDGTDDAWLASGLSAYSAGKVLEHLYGPEASVFKIGGVYPVYMYPFAAYHGVPVAAITGKVWMPEPYSRLPLYLHYAKSDAISAKSFRSLHDDRYGAIARDKSDLVLRTLEGVVGGAVMQKIIGTYFEEYRFGHPDVADFENVCKEVSGQKLGWFFEQFVYGTEVVDFAVSSIGYYKETDLSTGTSSYVTKVIVVRNGGVKMPVDLRLSLSDGSAVDTVWDGQSRWQRFTFHSSAPPDYAVLDPFNKIPMDLQYANNSLRVHAILAPVVKWAGRIVSYFQNMLLNVGMIV